MLHLDQIDVVAYLKERGQLAPQAMARVEALGGGVSNIVLRVQSDSHCLVLKQALPELRVAAHWPSRIDRVLREAECARVLGEYLPSDGAGRVPEVYFVDAENYVFGMACAPRDATLWKADLLAGRVDLQVARNAGVFLAQMHNLQVPAVAARFKEDEVFWQLRLDPYYRTIAQKHPDLQASVEEAIQLQLARKQVLVHGDYSPKNMFVLADKRILLLDFEVVHWGNPSFDLAFCLNHLCLKSIVNRHMQPSYFQASHAFVAAYREYARLHRPWEQLEEDVVLQLGCLMLARIDGKSPVEYIKDAPTQALVRRISRSLLLDRPANLTGVLSRIERETVSSPGACSDEV